MFTIRAQFTQIRRTEPTGKIHAQVKVLVDVADSTYTTCESAEIAREVILLSVQHREARKGFQVPMVITHTTIQRPAIAKLLRGCGIETKVKQTIVRYQILLTLIA